MKKLYGCKRCNKVGYTDPCACSGQVYALHLSQIKNADVEKPSIGNEDVFDRIDRELHQLRSQSINHAVKEDELADRIKSLDDKLEMLRDTISSVDRAYDEQVELLHSKIKSLEERITVNACLINDALITQSNRIFDLESKEKIQFENESWQDRLLKTPNNGPQWDNSLKEKYDKLWAFVERISLPMYSQELNPKGPYGDSHHIALLARKLLKELGE